jgi:hypothetical protein
VTKMNVLYVLLEPILELVPAWKKEGKKKVDGGWTTHGSE